MKILLIWGHKMRPWGYEVRVDLQDDLGRIYNEVLNFPAKDQKDIPDEAAIAKAIDSLVLRVEASRVAQELEQAQAPVRKAQEVRGEFMAAVGAGLIKADEAIVELQPFAAAKLVEPIKELG